MLFYFDIVCFVDLKRNERNGSRSLRHSNLYTFIFHRSYTLLHGATEKKMLRYCKLLVFFNFGIETSPYKCDETAWDVSITHPSVVHRYYESVLLQADTYDEPNKIESGYFSLKRQTQFGKFFCQYLGCFGKKPIIDIASNKNKEVHKRDPLYYDYNNCYFIDPVTSKPKKAKFIMKFICEVCVKLIIDKQPISDDLLVLCYNYCKLYDSEQAQRIRTALKEAVSECLQQNYKNVRNTEWFKHYLLNSNIWLLDSFELQNKQQNDKDDNDESKDKEKENINNMLAPISALKLPQDMDVPSASQERISVFRETVLPRVKKKLLYTYFIDIMNKQEQTQHEFISIKMSEEQEKHKEAWNQIKYYDFPYVKIYCQNRNDSINDRNRNDKIMNLNQEYKNNSSEKPDNNNTHAKPRQDNIDQIEGILTKMPNIKCIKPNFSETQLLEFDYICNYGFFKVEGLIFLFFVFFVCLVGGLVLIVYVCTFVFVFVNGASCEGS